MYVSLYIALLHRLVGFVVLQRPQDVTRVEESAVLISEPQRLNIILSAGVALPGQRSPG